MEAFDEIQLINYWILAALRWTGQWAGVKQYRRYYFANAKLRPATLYGVKGVHRLLALINAYSQLFKIGWLRLRLMASTRPPFRRI